MDIIATIAEELGIRNNQVDAAVKLIDEGNTIPFIARYRKEATGALNDEVLRNLKTRLNTYALSNHIVPYYHKMHYLFLNLYPLKYLYNHIYYLFS